MSLDDQIRDGLESLVEPVDGDAVMSAIDDRALRAASPGETTALRARRRWPLAAVAAVVLLAVALGGGLFLAGRRTRHVEVGPASDSPTSTPSSTVPDAGVTFLLVWSGSSEETAGSLRVLTSYEDSRSLWAATPSLPALPLGSRSAFSSEDQVMVVMTIEDGGCSPTLERFDRRGTTLTPVFRTSAPDPCGAPVSSTTTYVLLLDWDSIGSTARIVLPTSVSHAERTSSTEVRRPDAPPAATPLLRGRLVLAATVVPAGGDVNGEVVIDNDTGAPITFVGCKSPVDVKLHGHGVIQEMLWLMCSEDMTVPVGESRWPVTVSANLGMCGESTDPQFPRCVDGAIPPLPSGPYRAVVVWSSDAFRLEIPAVTVTVTP